MVVVSLILVGASCALPVGAQTTTALQSKLDAFLSARSGGRETVVVDGSFTARLPCARERPCTGSRTATLAAFHQGDAGGQALFIGDSKCATCLRVRFAGGGVLSEAELEDLGLDRATARKLLRGL